MFVYSEIVCPAPSDITHADLVYSDMTFLALANYTCHHGYRFKDGTAFSSIQCGVESTWTDLNSSCEG